MLRNCKPLHPDVKGLPLTLETPSKMMKLSEQKMSPYKVTEREQINPLLQVQPLTKGHSQGQPLLLSKKNKC